jgi:Sulfatase
VDLDHEPNLHVHLAIVGRATHPGGDAITYFAVSKTRICGGPLGGFGSAVDPVSLIESFLPVFGATPFDHGLPGISASLPEARRPNAGKAPTGKPALERTIGNLPPLGPATGTDDETIRNRARMLKSVDEGVGQMRAALERTGQLDNTVFVFTSDEGYFFGEHGLSIERRLAYEESIVSVRGNHLFQE